MLGGRFSLWTRASYSPERRPPQRLGVSTRPPRAAAVPQAPPHRLLRGFRVGIWQLFSSPPLRPPPTPGELTFRPIATQERYSTRNRALNQPLPSRRVRWAVHGVAEVTTLSQIHLDSPDSPTWRGQGPRGIIRPDRSLSSPALSPVTGPLRSALSPACPLPPEAWRWLNGNTDTWKLYSEWLWIGCLEVLILPLWSRPALKAVILMVYRSCGRWGYWEAHWDVICPDHTVYLGENPTT